MKIQKPAREVVWLGLGLLSGLLMSRVGSLRREGGVRLIGQLPRWERALTRRYGKQKAVLLAAQIQAGYEDLYAGRPRFSNPVLRIHLEQLILPAIALYRALLVEERGSQSAALDALESCFAEQFKDLTVALQTRIIDHLPGGFATLRLANRMMLRSGYPPEGWKIEWIEDSPQRIAYNITGCLYLNVLQAYGVAEITPYFCALDDKMYGNAKTVAWERTETLGRGDAACNFVLRPRVAQE